MKISVEPTQPQIDVTMPDIVQVQTDGKTLWVNVNGVCMFRACKIGVLILDDQRQPHFTAEIGPDGDSKIGVPNDEG